MSVIGNRKGDSALITALAGGATVKEAAHRAGVAECTAHRRLDDPEFRRQVDAARTEMIASAVGTLAKASTAAAVTLATLLGKEQPPSIRLGAARSILELGSKLRETQELEERIAALEERVAQQGQRRRA